MDVLPLNVEPRAQAVRCTDTELIVELTDGRVVSTPLVWFPRLANASPDQRNQLGHGQGIHWPAVDEDISVLGLLAGHPSVEYRKPPTV
ncbi:MAG: DUF2442 domain-containing protein [Burkholderiaceae bacterium]|nr:MAG: DUF2442 domain-containing protein [Burkholderiaceae bacterium]